MKSAVRTALFLVVAFVLCVCMIIYAVPKEAANEFRYFEYDGMTCLEYGIRNTSTYSFDCDWKR